MACAKAIVRAAVLAAAIGLAAPGMAQNSPTYDVVSSDPNGLELRFHGVPLKGVHADDSQNALSIDFQQPVDGAVFDRLAGDQPQWISMAYANYDNGVIRANRPVTFLTRQEPDGFSLKIVPRGPAPAQGPPPPMALRGSDAYGGYPPPPGYPPPGSYPPPAYGAPVPPAFQRSDTFGAARNYYGQQLAVKRADPGLLAAYDDANRLGDSEMGIGSEYRNYDNGDRIIASHARGRLYMGGGLSLIGTLDDTDAQSPTAQTSAGAAAPIARNVLTGEGGVALALDDGSELKGEVTGGNGMIGGLVQVLSTSPDGYWFTNLAYHQPDMDSPVAIANHAAKDDATMQGAYRFGYGLWGAMGGHYDRFELPSLTEAAQTAGWTANLRWNADLGGLLAGISYDGLGDYVVDSNGIGLAALGIHDMEVHAGSASLSGGLWDGLWFDIYGGYAGDRYAGEGLFEGASLRYTPEPGFNLELGVRRSMVSFSQGELGPETTAGLRLTMGFGGPGALQFLDD